MKKTSKLRNEKSATSNIEFGERPSPPDQGQTPGHGRLTLVEESGQPLASHYKDPQKQANHFKTMKQPLFDKTSKVEIHDFST